MPERKLSYRVDVDTGQAVSDLARLGTAGESAGKDIARGFDQAESASKAALSALSAQLDKVQADAKASAEAVAAIKAHLTVDIDDAKVDGFVSDLKNKMGLAFDDVTADAKQFAAVLERGVDLSKTTNEIKGVGTALDHTRGEADQSRSVLANLAGNTAQDLGELGGVVGSLGVGVGQLAEYAVDGNISLGNLAGLAGPMAALAVAGAGVQSVMKNIAETKAFDVDQIKAFADAFADVGDTASALATSLEGAFNVRVDDTSLFGRLLAKQETTDLADNLAAVGVSLSDIDQIIRSGADTHEAFTALSDVGHLSQVLNAAGVDARTYEAIMEGVWETTRNWTTATDGAAKSAEFFGSSLSTINDAIETQLIKEDPFTRFDQGLFQTGGHLVDLRAIWNDVVRDMSDDDASFDTTAGNVDILAQAMNLTVDEVVALARGQTDAKETTDDLAKAAKAATDASNDQSEALRGTVDALQALIDKQNEMISASEDLAQAQQDWDDALADLPATVAASTAAMDEATGGSADWVAAQRDQRDAVEALVDQYVRASELQAEHIGEQFTPVDKVNAQAHALAMLAGTVDARVIPALADYYAGVLNIPKERRTEFEMILARGDQDEIETFVQENSGTKTLAVNVETDTAKLAKVNQAIDATTEPRTAAVTAQAHTAVAAGQLATLGKSITVPINANADSAKETAGQFRRDQESTPIYVPVKTYAAGGTTYTKSSPGSRSAEPAAAVSTFAAAPTPMSAATAPVGPVVVTPPPVTVNLSAGVIGNRYDMQRWVRSAMRAQERLGRGSAGGEGATGPQGPPGADSTVPGPPGATGPQGPQGVQGTPGTPATYSAPAA